MLGRERFYESLDLPTTATSRDVHMAYLKLATLWDPNTNKDPKAPERFKEVCMAYRALSSKRVEDHTYDFATISEEDVLSLFSSVFGLSEAGTFSPCAYAFVDDENRDDEKACAQLAELSRLGLHVIPIKIPESEGLASGLPKEAPSSTFLFAQPTFGACPHVSHRPGAASHGSKSTPYAVAAPPASATVPADASVRTTVATMDHGHTASSEMTGRAHTAATNTEDTQPPPLLPAKAQQQTLASPPVAPAAPVPSQSQERPSAASKEHKHHAKVLATPRLQGRSAHMLDVGWTFSQEVHTEVTCFLYVLPLHKDFLKDRQFFLAYQGTGYRHAVPNLMPGVKYLVGIVCVQGDHPAWKHPPEQIKEDTPLPGGFELGPREVFSTVGSPLLDDRGVALEHPPILSNLKLAQQRKAKKNKKKRQKRTEKRKEDQSVLEARRLEEENKKRQEEEKRRKREEEQAKRQREQAEKQRKAEILLEKARKQRQQEEEKKRQREEAKKKKKEEAAKKRAQQAEKRKREQEAKAAEEERKRKQELVEYEKYLLERKKELEREEEERVKKELEYFAKLKKEQDEQRKRDKEETRRKKKEAAERRKKKAEEARQKALADEQQKEWRRILAQQTAEKQRARQQPHGSAPQHGTSRTSDRNTDGQALPSLQALQMAAATSNLAEANRVGPPLRQSQHHSLAPYPQGQGRAQIHHQAPQTQARGLPAHMQAHHGPRQSLGLANLQQLQGLRPLPAGGGAAGLANVDLAALAQSSLANVDLAALAQSSLAMSSQRSPLMPGSPAQLHSSQVMSPSGSVLGSGTASPTSSLGAGTLAVGSIGLSSNSMPMFPPHPNSSASHSHLHQHAPIPTQALHAALRLVPNSQPPPGVPPRPASGQGSVPSRPDSRQGVQDSGDMGSDLSATAQVFQPTMPLDLISSFLSDDSTKSLSSSAVGTTPGVDANRSAIATLASVLNVSSPASPASGVKSPSSDTQSTTAPAAGDLWANSQMSAAPPGLGPEAPNNGHPTPDWALASPLGPSTQPAFFRRDGLTFDDPNTMLGNTGLASRAADEQSYEPAPLLSSLLPSGLDLGTVGSASLQPLASSPGQHAFGNGLLASGADSLATWGAGMPQQTPAANPQTQSPPYSPWG